MTNEENAALDKLMKAFRVLSSEEKAQAVSFIEGMAYKATISTSQPRPAP